MPDIYTCTVCGCTDCVPVYGNLESPVLLVGEFPGGDEIQKGVPFIGRTGTILTQQLAKLGWSLRGFRVMNLWNHAPNKNQDCFLDGKQKVIDEAWGEPEKDLDTDVLCYPKQKRAILLIGSDTVKEFTDYNVSDVCGMPVKSAYLPEDAIIYAIYNPAIVFHGVHGEIVLALTKFVKEIEKFYD